MAKQFPPGTKPLRRALAFATRGVTRQSEYGISRNLAFSEETVTDLLLVDLARRLGNHVVIKKFSKHAESDTGADWVWWFGSRTSGWFGMRVQAKRMDPTTHDYPYLDHMIRSTGNKQIDVLISSARSQGLFPGYIFYNAFVQNVPTPRLNWNCDCHSVHQKHLGCVLVSAEVVKRQKSLSRFSVKDAARLGKPLHCIDCNVHMDGGPHSLAEKSRNYAVTLRRFTHDIDSDDDRDVPPVARHLPSEYEALLDLTSTIDSDELQHWPLGRMEIRESLAGVVFVLVDDSEVAAG